MRATKQSLLVFGLMCTSLAVPAAESPEDVVLAYLAAMKSDGVQAAAARFTHPDDCVEFKNLLMPRIRKSFTAKHDDFVTDTFGRELALADLEAMPPPEFLSRFLWRSRVDARNYKPPRFVGSTRDGNVVHLVALTRSTSMDGFTTDRRDVYTLKASGDGWKLALDEKLLKFAKQQTAK
jgi:hypothetical protein